jgi:hypothetical protein
MFKQIFPLQMSAVKSGFKIIFALNQALTIAEFFSPNLS